MKNLFTTAHRRLALVALLTAGSMAAHAQNVGIGTTAPDVSAALDIVSSSKGVLLPRVAATAGVPTPATGLIVYQTGGTPGYYYNSGTPGAPVWQQFATAAGAAVTASNGLTKTGSNIALGGTLTGATTIAQAGNNFSLTGGNVGIGTASPAARLDVRGSGGFGIDLAVNGRLRTGDGANNGGVWLDAATTQFMGQFDATTVGIYNNLDWRLLVANNGNVGIGTTAPTAKLDVNGTGNFAGNVGIGTNAPTTRLDVRGDGRSNVDMTVNGRLRTGDAANNGGVWLDAATTQFVGQFDANTLGLWNNGSFRLLVANNGNVGIGTTAPTYKLEVAGDINAVGQVRANGVVLTSDARFKQQVRPLGGALAAVQALRGVRYTWNALGIRHGGQAGAEQVGVLAQELEKVFPELVSTGPDGYKAVNYAQLTPVLIEAIKEQQQQIEALKAQNTADHASLQTLQAQMARLLGETAPAGAQASK